MVAIGLVVSEEKSFEIVDGRRTDDGRTDDGRRTAEPTYTISSPGAFGSGELKNFNVKLFANADAAANANADARGSTIALPGLRPGELKMMF